jgi:tetratricopeptide (TPR) repeat protein
VAIEMLSIAGPLARARLTSFIVRCAWVSIVPLHRIDLARDAVHQWQALGDNGEQHAALLSLGGLSAREGHFDEGERALSDARQLERSDWPPGRRAGRAFAEGIVATFRNQAQRCRACMTEAMTLYDAARMPANRAVALYSQAEAALMEGAIDESVAICRRAVEALRRLDCSWDLGCVLAGLCECLLRARDFRGAHEAAAQALPILDATNDLRVMCDQLAALGVVAENHSHAALLLGFADAWNEANRIPRTLSLMMLAEQAANAIESKLGASELQRLRRAGAGLGDAQVSAIAREILAQPPRWPARLDAG